MVADVPRPISRAGSVRHEPEPERRARCWRPIWPRMPAAPHRSSWSTTSSRRRAGCGPIRAGSRFSESLRCGPDHESRSVTLARRLVLAAAVVLVAAIGFAVLRPPSGTNVGGSSVQTASPTPAPTATPVPTPAPSSSVGVAGACDLMTADEAGNALRISAVTAFSLPFFTSNREEVADPTVPSYFCTFNSGDRSLFVLRWEPGTGADAFASWKMSTGAEAVSGLGDGAVWYPAKTTLLHPQGRSARHDHADGRAGSDVDARGREGDRGDRGHALVARLPSHGSPLAAGRSAGASIRDCPAWPAPVRWPRRVP